MSACGRGYYKSPVLESSHIWQDGQCQEPATYTLPNATTFALSVTGAICQ
jgi:hypothetical protein